MSGAPYFLFRSKIVLHIAMYWAITVLEHTVVPLLLIASLGFVGYVSLQVPAWFKVAYSIDARTQQKDRIMAENEIMRTLAQVFGGALVLAGLYFTAKNVFISRRNQTDERFADAVEKLGDASLPRRLGAIHALESVALESIRDHSRVMELFTDYIRHFTVADEAASDRSHPPPDVQQMLVAIGRRRLAFGLGERRALDFRGADLSGADLRGANLEGADFTNANLVNAVFHMALLRRARFAGCRLGGANFNLADLRDASFYRASAPNIQCRRATLRRTAFTWCELTKGSFEQSKLTHVDFSNATLDRADFSEARVDLCVWHKTSAADVRIDGAVLDPEAERFLKKTC